MRQIRIGEHDGFDVLDGGVSGGELGFSLRKAVKKVGKAIKKVSPVQKIKKVIKKHSPIAKLIKKPKKSSSSAAPEPVEEVVYEDTYVDAPQDTDFYASETAPYAPSPAAPYPDEYDAYDQADPYDEGYPEVNPTSTAADDDDEDDDDVDAARSLSPDGGSTPVVAAGGNKMLGPIIVFGGIALVGVAAYLLFLRKK